MHPDLPQFDLKKLYQTPRHTPAREYEGWNPQLQALYYDCSRWNGRQVKAFAWMGLPKPKKRPDMFGHCPGSWRAWNSHRRLGGTMEFQRLCSHCHGYLRWRTMLESVFLWPRH